ncbi:helix-turn-helix domain-containing protein [Helicobacter cetorum]|uniref:helix-turn-helix domain-containing protein n=1 Tax=Helicobacter cetorum TaxID=138563 RepID=UPI000CF0768F|nr:helix-turn-helix domain-containing protein [Helicobacter cetorum]
MLSSNDLFMIVLGAILLVLVCLVGYLYFKEKEFYHKMRRLEKTLDESYQENYVHSKRLKELEGRLEGIALDKNTKDDGSLRTTLSHLYSQLQEIQKSMDKERDYLEEKIIILENKFKDMGHYVGSDEINEKQVLKMYQEGYSVGSISKEFKVSKGEIEFILNMAGLK